MPTASIQPTTDLEVALFPKATYYSSNDFLVVNHPNHLVSGIGKELWGREHIRLAQGDRAGDGGEGKTIAWVRGRHRLLFLGLSRASFIRLDIIALWLALSVELNALVSVHVLYSEFFRRLIPTNSGYKGARAGRLVYHLIYMSKAVTMYESMLKFPARCSIYSATCLFCSSTWMSSLNTEPVQTAASPAIIDALVAKYMQYIQYQALAFPLNR